MVGGGPFRGRRKGDASAKKGRVDEGVSGGETREKYAFGGGRNAAAVYGVEEKMTGNAFCACMWRAGVLLLWCQICLAWAGLDEP